MDEKNIYHRFIDILLCIGDSLLIYFAFTITRQLDHFNNLLDLHINSLYLIFAFSWVFIGQVFNIYNLSKYSLLRSIGLNLFRVIVIHFALMSILLYSFFHILSIDTRSVIVLYLIIGLLMVITRVLYKLIRKYVEFSGFDMRKVVIVGTTQSGKALYNFFVNHSPNGYIFKGFFDNYPNPDIVNRKLVRGTIDDVKDYCDRENIDEIYFALPLTQKDLLERLTKFADDHCIYFRIAPDFSEVIKNEHNVYLYDSIPVLTTRQEPLGNSTNVAIKRIFDILFSLFVMVFIFPLVIPLIAIAIKLDSPGPVIFKQLRPGKKNKLFECYKFRTMLVNDTTEKMATKDDARITKVGAFLRKTSLDELPQFVNVLLGSMSVVGPRPNLVSQLEEYSKTLKKYKVRHFITPGITGFAQVNGCRGEIKEKESMIERVEFDVAYMEHWSLLLDLKIIFQTIKKIMYGDKHAY